MTNRKEKNHREFGSMEESNKKTSRKDQEKDKYSEENFDTTDSDAAEINPRMRQASQRSGNEMEEGDEDYDDENEDKKI